jgi:RimJ/RimL family protein N-acetyltransferase
MQQKLVEKMIIRELLAGERAKLLDFLLSLNEADRYRRFGRSMPDTAIRAYVAQIDWTEWVLLGAFNSQAELVGVLELAEARPGACEIAVAVAPSYRGKGMGKELMERALLKARVRGKDRVTLLCQADNEPMRRLARSAGLRAVTADGETEGELDLDVARPGDVVEERTREAIENVAYMGLLTTRAWADLVAEGFARAARVSEPA